MNIIHLPCVDSTSTYIATHCPDAPHGTVVIAHTQDAGRGQRGNHWEAAPGLNVTLSALLRPQALRASESFLLSEAVSVAVARALAHFLSPRQVLLKWPNDIYVGNGKLVGTLIENSLSGQFVTRSIIGVGVNVNQLRFLSDAPNPVSMAQLAGHTFPLDAVAQAVAGAIVDAPALLADSAALQAAYESLLWRRQALTPYIDCATGQHFRARIHAVEPSGHLILALPDAQMRRYAFKEVAADIAKL